MCNSGPRVSNTLFQKQWHIWYTVIHTGKTPMYIKINQLPKSNKKIGKVRKVLWLRISILGATNFVFDKPHSTTPWIHLVILSSINISLSRFLIIISVNKGDFPCSYFLIISQVDVYICFHYVKKCFAVFLLLLFSTKALAILVCLRELSYITLQASLWFAILLPQLPECWHFTHMLPSPGCSSVFNKQFTAHKMKVVFSAW